MQGERFKAQERVRAGVSGRVTVLKQE